MVGIAKSLERIATALTKNTLLASTFGVVDLVVTNVTATTGQHLSLVAVTGKDIIAKLTDASGARKFLIKDSGDNTVASIDSDGKITGTSFIGPVSGNLTGVLTNHKTGETTGAPTNAELIAAFGAVASVANGIVGTFTDTAASGKTYIVINNGTAYTVVESAAAA